jgi:hypothetical protein
MGKCTADDLGTWVRCRFRKYTVLSCFFISGRPILYPKSLTVHHPMPQKKTRNVLGASLIVRHTQYGISMDIKEHVGAHPYIRTRSPTSKSYTLTIHTCHLRKTLAIRSKFDFRLQDVGF